MRDRIMYVGSMYLIVRGMSKPLQCFVISSLRNKPTSANCLLPPASVSPVPGLTHAGVHWMLLG